MANITDVFATDNGNSKNSTGDLKTNTQTLVDSDNTIIDRADYNTTEEFEKALNDLMNNPDVMGVTAIEY